LAYFVPTAENLEGHFPLRRE